MRIVTAAALLLLSLPLAAPLTAQIVGRPPTEYKPRPNPFPGDSRLPGPGAGREARDIGAKVERGREEGAISRREARQLRREARRIASLSRLYRRDGLSDSERAELETRTHLLRSALSRPRAPAAKR